MRKKGLFEGGLIVVTTLLLILGSVYILIFVNRSITEKRYKELTKVLDQAALATEEGVNEKVDILYDLRGLFRLGPMNSGKWRDYTKAILEEHHTKDNSFAYVERVKREDLMKFEKVVRETEGPDYKNFVVFPKTEGTMANPIKYLHTIDADIKGLLGFDFQYSERTMSAMNLATLTDQPTMSELTHLNLIIPSSKKTGYELILPVYREAKGNETLSQTKSDNVIGFMGAWMNSESLKSNFMNLPGVKYSVYDGSEIVLTTGMMTGEKPLMVVSKEIDLYGRKLRIVLESDRWFLLSSFDESLPWMTLGAVTLIILFWIMSSFTVFTSKQHAERMAYVATKDLVKFKQVVDGVSDHVVITDPEGTITYANRSAQEITGYSLQEMVGNKPSLWGGQMPKEFYQNFWKIIKEDKKPFWGEIKNKRKNGELYEAEIHVSPILNEKGEILFFVGIEKDLNKKKSIEKMKTEFIALASHQLRTPLSAVKWFGEMLLDGDAGKLTNLQEKYVIKITESNEREIQIVNALLNVSRIESGKIVLQAKPISLIDLVESIMSEFKVNLVKENKRLSYVIDKKIPKISVDPDLIKHVYINLMSNAANYTLDGGTISVKVYLKGGKIVSEIADNGIGVPRDEKSRIFEKFFRASNALKKNTEGTGLGLYLTKTIVESSGGEIWFTSVEDKGTTFKFSLPLKAVKTASKGRR